MRLDDLKPHNLPINLVILGTKQLRPQPTMNTAPLIDTPLPPRVPEKRPVRDGRLLRRNPRIPLIRIPRVKMRVQMDDGDRPVHRLQAAKDGKNDAMITAETQDPRPLPLFIPLRRLMEQDLAIPLLHLPKRVRGIKRRNGDIPTINNTQVAICERVDAPYGVVAPALLLARTGGSDAAWPEARAGAVGGRGVVGEAEDGEVEWGGVGGGEAAFPGEVGEGYRLGEWEVFVEVFDWVGVVWAQV